jgi:hypothetical protein
VVRGRGGTYRVFWIIFGTLSPTRQCYPPLFFPPNPPFALTHHYAVSEVSGLKPCTRGLGLRLSLSRGSEREESWGEEENFAAFLEYTKVCPPQSIKRNRLFLVKEYYRLVALKAHKAPEGTVLHKAWINFNRKWN